MFMDAKLDLPIAIHDQALVRANWYLRTDCADDAMKRVLWIAHPQNHRRALLNAYLVCEDISLESIANRMRLSVEVVGLYSDLFFDIRQRQDEALLAELVYPEGRLPQLLGKTVKQPAEQTMLQLAYDYGVKEFERFAFPNRNNGQAESLASMAQKLEQRIFFDAMMLARMGGLNDSKLPVMKLANDLFCAKKKRRARREQGAQVPKAGAYFEPAISDQMRVIAGQAT